MTVPVLLVAGLVAWCMFVTWVLEWAASSSVAAGEHPVALVKLAERDAAAVQLLAASGLDVEEISERLRMPPGHVTRCLREPAGRGT